MVESMAGLEGPIDWVCLDPSGRVVLVQWAEPGEDLGALTHLIAQLRWVRPRLRDWHALAPSREIDPDQDPGGLLVARRFSARTCEAAAPLARQLRLARWIDVPDRAGLLVDPFGDAGLQTAAPMDPPEPESTPPAEDLGSRSHFRTRLRDEDL